MRTPHWPTCVLVLVLALPGLLFFNAASAETAGHSRPATAAKSSRPRLVVPDLKSSSVMVLDASDSSVLYSRKADAVLPVASITKLMTALVVLEGRQPMEEKVRITSEDRDTELGSTSRLGVGTTLSRGDLLHLALMSSENRAAHALGRNYPGGLKAFVSAMNDKAQVLGMKNTRFVDPTGLSSRNVSSAADLTRLVMTAAADPLISKYSTHKGYAVPVGKQMLEFHNTNSLVTKADWDIAVQKTGYTRDAGQCLVMKAEIQGRPVVIVLLNSFGKYTRVADARRIRKWMEARA